MSDPRAALARQAHRDASNAELQAAQYREHRDVLIRQLRAEDPKLWTYQALAKAVGCGLELVAHIIKRKQPKP